MARAGAVWVDVLPNMATFATSIRTGARINLSSFGASSGREFSQAMTSSARSGMAGFGAEVRGSADRAAAAVTAAATKVAAASAKQESAVGRLRVAQLQLAEAQTKTGLSASQMAAAEERVASAARANELAATGAARATASLGVAQKRADDEAARGKGWARFGANADAAGKRATSAVGGVLKSTLQLGSAFAGFAAVDFIAHSVKSAGDFQKEMNVLVTAGGEVNSNMKLVASGVQSIAVETGTSLSNLSAGMYTVEKAGIRGANGLMVLRAAAQGAKDENVDLATMTNALTSIMTSYHLKSGDAVATTNQLIAASGAAKTTMANFAGSLSTVLPIASAAGISFAQVSGAIATLTNHGTSADEATQELSNTIRNLEAPNRVAVNAMAQYGITANDVSTQLGRRGLTGTLDLLSTTVLQRMGPSGLVLLKTFNQSKVAAADADQMFKALPASVQAVAKSYADGSLTLKGWHGALKGMPAEQASLAAQWAVMQNKAHGFNSEIRSGSAPAQTYTQAIKQMTGGANGLNTTLQLTGENTGRFNANVAAVQKSAQGAGKDVAAWAVVQKSFNVQLDRFTQAVDVAGVKLGTALLPGLTKVATGLADSIPMVTRYAGEVSHAVQANKGWAVPVGAGLLAAVVAYKAASVAVTAVNFALGVGRSVQQAFAFATRTATVAQEAENVAVRANPIGLLATGIGLVVTGLMAWHNHTQRQKQAVDDLTQSIIADNGAVGDSTKADLVNGLMKNGTLAKYRALGISIPLVTSAYMGNAAAQAAVTRQLDIYSNTAAGVVAMNGEYGTSVSTVTQQGREQAATAKTLSSDLAGNSSAMAEAKAKADLYAQGMRGTAVQADAASGKVDKLTTAAQKMPKQARIDITLSTNAAALYKQLLSLGPNVAVAAQGLKNRRTVPMLASGGPVIGAGGPRDDQVPLWGSHGEYMINAKSTAKHRPLVEAINKDTLPRYADGGPIPNTAGSTWSARTRPDGLLGQGSGYSPLVGTVPPKAMAQVMTSARASIATASAASGGGGSYGGPMPTGGAVTRWAPLVLSTLGELGLSGTLVPKVLRQIQTESGGDPNATQGAIGDVNNRSGDLARGLMQVIGATFNAFAGPYRSLGQYNPHASIYAGLNYAKGRYGPDLSFLGQGHGYDRGGRWEHGSLGVNLSGHREQVLNPVQERAFTAAMDRVGSPSPVATADRAVAPVLNARIFIGDVELKDIVRVEIDADHEAHATLLGYGTG